MKFEKAEVDKLVSLIVKYTHAKNAKVDFSANGDIIIDIVKDDKDSQGILKGEPLPDKNIHKKYKSLSEGDAIDSAVRIAIAEWCIEMRIKFGEVEWNSKTLA